MIMAKLVNEQCAAYIEYRLMSKRGLILTIILGNIIFFLTIAFGNILAVISPVWLIAFYILSQLFVYADYKYGKRVVQFKLIFNKSEVGFANITGEWSTNYQQLFPRDEVKKITFRESTFSLTFLVGNSQKKYNLSRYLPLPLIMELLEITADKSGIPCEVIP